MALPKKLLALSVSAVAGISLLVGGGTYALFNSTAQNTGNTFQSGSLVISQNRDDVPITGPMFYTNDFDAASNGGAMGTGLWQPTDSHTRAMFIHDDGTVDAKMVSLTATPEGTTNDQANAVEFANQAHLTVTVLEPNNPGDADARAYDKAVQDLDKYYRETWHDNYLNRLVTLTGIPKDVLSTQIEFYTQKYSAETRKQVSLQAIADTKAMLINRVFGGYDASLTVRDIYDAPMSDMVNTTYTLPAANQFEVKVNHPLYVGYTVTLLDEGTQNNVLQGKNVKFTFSSTFQQDNNNPNQ